MLTITIKANVPAADAQGIKEREHILSEDTVYFSTAPYNESVDMIIGNHYFCKIF